VLVKTTRRGGSVAAAQHQHGRRVADASLAQSKRQAAHSLCFCTQQRPLLLRSRPTHLTYTRFSPPHALHARETPLLPRFAHAHLTPNTAALPYAHFTFSVFTQATGWRIFSDAVDASGGAYEINGAVRAGARCNAARRDQQRVVDGKHLAAIGTNVATT